MVDCFTNDYAMNLRTKDIREKVCPHFLRLDTESVSPLLLALDDGDPVGFLIYQVDSQGSDWCERPGWGFIRECYVTPARRRSGVAAELVRAAEQRLSSDGITDAYLTSDDAIRFWEACGWSRSEVIARNSGVILEKTLVPSST